MSETLIFRIAKFTVVGLFLLATACSSLVVIQPTSEAHLPTAQPTQDVDVIYTVAAQTIQAQMPTQTAATATSAPTATGGARILLNTSAMTVLMEPPTSPIRLSPKHGP